MECHASAALRVDDANLCTDTIVDLRIFQKRDPGIFSLGIIANIHQRLLDQTAGDIVQPHLRDRVSAFSFGCFAFGRQANGHVIESFATVADQNLVVIFTGNIQYQSPAIFCGSQKLDEDAVG